MTLYQLRQAAKELAAKGGRSATGTAKRRPRAHYVRAGKLSVIAKAWIPVCVENPKTTGSCPVITRSKPGEWTMGSFHKASQIWMPPDVVMWFPLIGPTSAISAKARSKK